MPDDTASVHTSVLATARAAEWLIAHGLAPRNTELLAYCRSQLVGLRTDLRAVFAAHVDGSVPDPSALDGINRALTAVPSALLLSYDETVGLRRVPIHPTQILEHAMVQIAEDAAALLTGDSADALSRCPATPCDRFLLRTHARRHWCSTRCGDRVRAARAYARRSRDDAANTGAAAAEALRQ